jgi:hypothetical protein
MFKPILLDNSDYCNVLKHSLSDDLLPFSLNSENQLNYDSGALGNLTSKYNTLSSLATNSTLLDVWQPIFINSDTNINTKLLSSYGSYHNSNPNLKSCRLGIENFYSFTGNFKSFSNTANMSIDWIINSSNIPYYLCHGILCWYRYNNFSDNPNIMDGKLQTIDKFPNGSRLTPSTGTDKIYIKLNDNKLYDISNPSKIFQNNSWTFNAEANTSIVDVPSNVTFKLAHKEKDTDTTTKDNNLNPTFWIPDGDCFFYYDNTEDVALSSTNNIPPKSYISSSLYKSYNLIYRIITLDEERNIKPKNLRKSRLYRSLAHALSTSPFITDFTIKALDTTPIRNLIQQYVNTAVFPNAATSQALLNTLLINISTQLQKTISNVPNDSLYLDTKFTKNTIHNNIIRNKNDLFYKLFQKYGAYANITVDTTFSVKTDTLKIDNRGISVFQIAEHYCNKNLVNQTIYNNQTITFDNTKIATNFGEHSNDLVITNSTRPGTTVDIPLYNTIRPSFNGGQDGPSIFKPSLMYSGYVDKNYREDGLLFHPEVTPEDAINNLDNVYYAQIDNDAQIKLNSDPYAEHISNLSEQLDQMSIMSISDVPSIPGLFNSKNDDNGISLQACLCYGTDRLVVSDGAIRGMPTDYLEQTLSVTWENVSEKKGFFGENKFDTGVGNTVQFYPLYTGKHILKCTVLSPFGSFIKYKAFYVVDGKNLNNAAQYGKYWDPITRSWTSPPTTIEPNAPLVLDTDNILCNLSQLNKIAINNIVGVFVPIKTNCTIRQSIGDFALSSSLEEHIISELGGNCIFKFDNNFNLNSNPILSINYRISPSNTTIKLYSIWLERIRTDDPKCAQCFSMFYPRLKSEKTNTRIVKDNNADGTLQDLERNYNKVYRDRKYPEGFDLRKYTYDVSVTGYIKNAADSAINFAFPQISTQFAPPIKSYGGYSRVFLDSIEINVTGLDKPQTNTTLPIVPNPLISNTGNILPKVTGYPLNKPNLIYMQKAIPVDGSGLKIPFVKGIFHPASGWISYSGSLYSANANKSAVLKFNPGARDSFSFIGPQLNKLKPAYPIHTGNQIPSKIFSSTISLSISDQIQWECCEGTDAANQQHKNYVDIQTNVVDSFNSNHGYRILHGGEPKIREYTAGDNDPTVNDEFGLQQENGKFSYKFAVTGPFSSAEGSQHLRIPRINNLKIKDLEVKLNFLNYVNTKNLIVWLDVEYDPREKATRSEATDSPLALRSKDFINQTINQNVFFGDYTYNEGKVNILANSGLNKYLKNLLNFNSASGLDNNNFKLVLLNQETIYNNGYNFNIKFSDHASKHNSLYEIVNSQNYYSTASGSEYSYLLDQIRSKQTIFQNNHEVLPTTAATGFSDRECCNYNSIIKLNQLNIPNNKFNKFVSDSLFRNVSTADCQNGRLNGETNFTLNIMVLDDEDDMSPLDNTITAQYLSEFETVKNIEKSRLISNSLCSWSLVLHTESERDFIPESHSSLTSYGGQDVLGLIDYKKGLKYNGHSFIADLSSYKHLLPLVNFNAPNSCISDDNLCMDAKNDPTGQTNMQRPPTFPNYAILAIMASTAGAAAMGGMGAVGVLAGIAGINNDNSYRVIIDFLKETSFQSALQYEMRQIYLPNYGKYPFGTPEKILINFKKDNSLWHTAEASILKYHNTPILKNNQYKFIRLSRHNDFGKFSYKKVTSYQELIDTKFIKNISGVSDGTVLNPPSSYNNIIVNSGDILYDIANSGLYLAETNAALITDATNKNNKFENLNRANLYISQNSVLSFGSASQQLWHNDIISSDISGNKMISMPGRIPYDIFGYNDSIILMSGTTTVSNTIAKKALILQNNTYNSVFVMSSPIQSGYDIMCPNDNDTIFLTYKNETTVQDKVKNKYNIWGLNDTSKVINATVDLQPTCNSIGSYGDASIFLEKNVLSNNIRNNKLKNISELLNNHENDKIKHAKITLFQPSGTGTINESIINLTPSPAWVASKTYGYSYSKDEFINPLLYRTEELNRDVVIIASGDKDQRIFENLDLSSAYNDMPKNISIIRTYYNQTLPTGIQNGILEVEGDYYNHIPIGSITSDELTKLTDRLNLIQNTGIQTSLESIVGKPDQTATTNILASDRLKYIVQHYNSLPADSGSCDSRTSTSFTNCHKKNTFNKMEQLYQEEYDIADLIRNQTVLLNNVLTLRSSLPDAHPLKINNDILPKYGPVISGTDGPISIEYKKLNEDHYWINFDPNQGCFADFESNPKVLVSTKYNCLVTNYSLSEISDGINNVCPSYAPQGELAGERMKFTHESKGDYGHDYTYTVDADYVNEQMAKLQQTYGSAFTEWREIIKTRYFNINGDQTFDSELAPGAEITITANETYKVPIVTYSSISNGSTDNSDLPGMGSCDGSNGSPPGKGLLTLDTQNRPRVGRPVTIANTVNLSNSNNISVMIKKIPRMLRGVDLLSTVYRPGALSDYRQIGFTNPLIPLEIDLVVDNGRINNSFYVWFALEIQNNSTLRYVSELPDFLKLQNEMVFRSFFGSVDRIENKTDSIVAGYPWEIIPFEYDKYEP